MGRDFVADALHQLTALGAQTPRTVDIGPLRISERCDVALASLAIRRGQEAAFRHAAAALGVPLPAPSRFEPGTPLSAFWVAPEMWFVEAPFESFEDIVGHLKPAFGAAASITEQTDAWVRFDLSAPDLTALMERLCTVDFPVVPTGYASRTVIEHLGCYLVKRGNTEVTLYGPRSAAKSLLHAVETAAGSVI